MRAHTITVYNPQGREVLLAEGEVAPAGWFTGGRPPVELQREHRVLVTRVYGEDLDMDEDDPLNVRVRTTLVPVWTEAELADSAAEEGSRINAANDALRARQARHAELVADCAAKNAANTTTGRWEVSGHLVVFVPAMVVGRSSSSLDAGEAGNEDGAWGSSSGDGWRVD